MSQKPWKLIYSLFDKKIYVYKYDSKQRILFYI